MADDRQALIETVLAAHVRGDWSDRTYTCQGCSERTQAEVDAEWAIAVDEFHRRELRSRLNRASKPDWTLAEYHAHVAAHIAAALIEGR